MPYKIGIIDIFGKYKGAPICDVKYKYAHGTISLAVLQTMIPQDKVKIIKYKAKACKDNINHIELKSLLKQLKRINKDKNGKLDYLNLSAFSYYPITQFGKNGELLAKPQVQKQLLSDIDSNILAIPIQVKHILEELKRITNDGTQVVVSAGNSSHKFNLYSLCDKVRTIGGYNLKTQEPVSYLSHNPLVDEYVPLPIYVSRHPPDFIKKNLKTINLSQVFDLQHSFAKLSKKELKKRVATQAEHEELAKIIQTIYETDKLKFDLHFITTRIQRSVPQKLQNKIYDISKFQEIFADKFDKEIVDSITALGTHCDLTYTQFFDLSCKGEKHVISQKKTTKVRQAISGTTFCPGQYIADDITKNSQNINNI